VAPLAEAVALAAVLFGAATQRISGMGFALVAAPFLVVVLGPIDGVLVVNTCGALTAGIILARVFRRVEWARCGRMLIGAAAGTIPGAILVGAVDSAWLEAGIGVTLLVTIGIQLRTSRRTLAATAVRDVAVGSISGFMNVTAGVGGPAMSTYALASRWNLTSFAATMQAYFLALGLTSLGAKAVFAHPHLPALGVWFWILVLAACLVGMGTGELLVRVVSPRVVRIMLIAVAGAGAAATTARGVIDLLG